MLFCKPPSRTECLIEEPFGPAERIWLRSLHLKKDLVSICQWSRAPQAQRFWQLEGTTEEISSFYRGILRNPDAHTFIGMLDELPICQIDCYRVQTDELGQFIPCSYHDAGIHFLMAPVRAYIPGISSRMLALFMRYFFAFEQAERLYAEPDIYNHKACQLLNKNRFQFIENIMLPSKAASVYLMTRKQFYGTPATH